MAIQKKPVGFEESGSFAKAPVSGSRQTFRVISKELKEIALLENKDSGAVSLIIPVAVVGGESDGFDGFSIMCYVGKNGEYGEYSKKPLEKWTEYLLASCGDEVFDRFVAQLGEDPDYFSSEVADYFKDYCVGAKFEAVVEYERVDGKAMTEKDTGNPKLDKDGKQMFFDKYENVKFKKVKILEAEKGASSGGGVFENDSAADEESF